MSGYVLHLMRHEEPEGAGRMLGHGDAPPLEAGAEACVAKSAKLEFGAILSSDLMRARVPAERIAALSGLELRTDSGWRELDFGAWDGLHARMLDPALLAAFWADPDASPPPGGERWSSLCGRVAKALERIDQDTLVLAHAGSIRAALSLLCGFDYRDCWAIDLPYGALLSLQVHAGGTSGARITALQP